MELQDHLPFAGKFPILLELFAFSNYEAHMNTRHYYSLIMLWLVLVNGSHSVTATELKKDGSDAQPNPAAIAGHYCSKILYDTDLLTLASDGNFSTTHSACGGQDGAAYGKWIIEGKIVKLQTERAYKSRKEMEGTSTSFDVLLSKGEWVLLRSDLRDYYEKHGSPDGLVFRKVKK